MQNSSSLTDTNIVCKHTCLSTAGLNVATPVLYQRHDITQIPVATPIANDQSVIQMRMVTSLTIAAVYVFTCTAQNSASAREGIHAMPLFSLLSRG